MVSVNMDLIPSLIKSYPDCSESSLLAKNIESTLFCTFEKEGGVILMLENY
jgi:hypothetical protein